MFYMWDECALKNNKSKNNVHGFLHNNFLKVINI